MTRRHYAIHEYRANDYADFCDTCGYKRRSALHKQTAKELAQLDADAAEEVLTDIDDVLGIGQLLDVAIHAGPDRSIDARVQLRDRIEELEMENNQLRELLSIICTNAVVIPDPRMDGATDTYSVPLDDIEAAQTALGKSQLGKEQK